MKNSRKMSRKMVKKKYPCISCRKHCGVSSVKCNTCQNWCHFRCAKISFYTAQRIWSWWNCEQCKQHNNAQMDNDQKDNDQMGNDQMDYDHMDNALPTSSTRPNISSRPQKKFSCGQGTCDYSADRRYNVTRHQINSCRWVPEKEWKLKEKTCELCGQLLSAMKLVKPHQRTNYCQNQQRRKRQGLDVKMYKYSERISCILLNTIYYFAITYRFIQYHNFQQFCRF